MPELTNRPNDELLLRIVAAEQQQCDCNGIGKIPVLSAEIMRLPCPCPAYCVAYVDSPDDMDWRRCSACSKWRSKGIDVMGEHGTWCDNCQGRNWIPTPDPWAMKVSLIRAGYDYTESTLEDEVYVIVARPFGQCITMNDPNPKRAFLLAVAKSFKAV